MGESRTSEASKMADVDATIRWRAEPLGFCLFAAASGFFLHPFSEVRFSFVLHALVLSALALDGVLRPAVSDVCLPRLHTEILSYVSLATLPPFSSFLFSYSIYQHRRY